jgi:hypothetical protein
MDSCAEYSLGDRPRNGDEQSACAEAHDEKIGATEARRATTRWWLLTRRKSNTTNLKSDGQLWHRTNHRIKHVGEQQRICTTSG